MGWRLGQAYGQDLRDRVLAAQGRLGEVAERFAVSCSYVYRVRAKRRRTGQCCAGVQRCHQALRLEQRAGLKPALLAHIAAQPDATLEQLRGWLRREQAVHISIGALHKTLRRWALTLKKRRCRPPSSGAPMYKKHANAGATHSLR